MTSLPISRRAGGILSRGVLFLSLVALCGCVSDDEVEPIETKTEATATVSNRAEYGRTLQLLDVHVGKYVFWKSQPGGKSSDASRERYVERMASVSMVRLYQDQLIETAGDSSDLGRQRIAAKSLAFATDPSAVTTLASLLRIDGDTRLIVNATFALAELRSPSTPAPPLIDMLSHIDPDVRNNSLLALHKTMESRRMTGAPPLLPIEKAQAVPLIEAALFEPSDPQIRGHAAACLGTIGDRASVEPLINLLPDPEPFVRTRTAVALGNIGDPRAITALVAVIDETSQGTPRTAVTLALQAIVERGGRTVPPYMAQTERAWIAFLKERLGPESFIPGSDASGGDSPRR